MIVILAGEFMGKEIATAADRLTQGVAGVLFDNSLGDDGDDLLPGMQGDTLVNAGIGQDKDAMLEEGDENKDAAAAPRPVDAVFDESDQSFFPYFRIEFNRGDQGVFQGREKANQQDAGIIQDEKDHRKDPVRGAVVEPSGKEGKTDGKRTPADDLGLGIVVSRIDNHRYNFATGARLTGLHRRFDTGLFFLGKKLFSSLHFL